MVQIKYIRCTVGECTFRKQVNGQPEADRAAREHRAEKIGRHRDFLYVQATEVYV